MRYIILTLTLFFLAGTSYAADREEFNLVIKNHVFIPSELVIPADKKVKIVIDNQDPTPEEFESHDLHREKVIPGGQKGIILVGPLEKGEYKFFGEFNEKTAQGILKVQ